MSHDTNGGSRALTTLGILTVFIVISIQINITPVIQCSFANSWSIAVLTLPMTGIGKLKSVSE